MNYPNFDIGIFPRQLDAALESVGHRLLHGLEGETSSPTSYPSKVGGFVAPTVPEDPTTSTTTSSDVESSDLSKSPTLMPSLSSTGFVAPSAPGEDVSEVGNNNDGNTKPKNESNVPVPTEIGETYEVVESPSSIVFYTGATVFLLCCGALYVCR